MQIQGENIFAEKRWRNKLAFCAQAITLSEGWKKYSIAFAAGAFGSLSLPPVGFFPASSILFIPVVWLLDGCTPLNIKNFKRGFIESWTIGWVAGFGYFVAGLWWLGTAFFVEADQFAWALPLGVLGLPACLACFTGFGTSIAKFLWHSGSSRIFALAIGLGLSELARGYFFTGFPWNSFGMSLGSHLVLAQIASLIGLYGLTILAIFIFASPAVISDLSPKKSLSRSFVLLLAIGLFAAAIVFGIFRLVLNEAHHVEGVSIRLVQPNVAQDDKFRVENRDAIMDRYLELTAASRSGLFSEKVTTHVFWPESPFPFILGKDVKALSQIASALNENRHLITGAARSETRHIGLPGEMPTVVYFNSVQVVGPDASILETYDKVHLVPFGEYIPFSFLLDALSLRQFVQIPGGFEAGLTRKLMAIPGLPPAFPLICYEAVFPAVLDPSLRQKAGLMVNVTNDGWFGRTPGPYQHFAQARLRSIELGLPLVRVANTGISAIIDPYGRVIASLPLGVAGVIDGDLPAPLPPPLFSRGSSMALLVCFALLFLGFALTRYRP